MINRNYKDRLFRAIFGYEKHKENLLSLYNALNGTYYTNVDELVINTIDDVLYMGMKNDVSCIIENRISLYEHQSTNNPNMPLRGFMYFGDLYEKYLAENQLNIYGRSLVKIPTPKYYVFYNGTESQPDNIKLKLSDAFTVPDDSGEFEWTATVLNINLGHNQKLMAACKVLNEYAILVETIRKYTLELKDVETAVDQAVKECISNKILEDFLTSHRAEVKDMILTEYDHEKTMQMIRDEAIREGLEEGREKGLIEGREKGLIEGREKGLLEGREKGRQEGRQEGREEGREEGRQEGRQEGLQESVKILLKTLNPEQIIKMGFDSDLVMNIYNNMK